MRSFAYLIVAHENTIILKTLIKLLDDERNDLYIHMDAKNQCPFEEELKGLVQFSNIYFVEKRTTVYWGHISQVETEYKLFEMAYNHKRYDYYHLISASDLPIKNQNYIHDFFELNYGYEFIGFASHIPMDFIETIYLFPKMFRNSKKCVQKIRNLFLLLQKHVKYNTVRSSKLHFKKGTNWVSVTHDFVETLLSYKEYMLANFKYSKSFDEFYKHTIAYNTPFKDKIYSYDDEFMSNMRLIDWERGYPYSWKLSDFDEIRQSDKLFCRKIEDVELAHELYQINKLR